VNLLEKQLSTVYFKDVRFPCVTLCKHVSDFGRLRSYDRLKLRIEVTIIDNKRNKIINQHNT